MKFTLYNKVIEGLIHCTTDECCGWCSGCPYESNDPEVRCMENLMEDSFHLIKYLVEEN